MCFGSTEESIHPFSAPYLGLDHGGSRPSREAQTSLSQTTSSSSSGDTEAFPSQLKDVTSAANPVNLFFHSLACTVQLVQQCICVGFSFSQTWGPYYVELHTSISLAWCIMPSWCTFFPCQLPLLPFSLLLAPPFHHFFLRPVCSRTIDEGKDAAGWEISQTMRSTISTKCLKMTTTTVVNISTARTLVWDLVCNVFVSKKTIKLTMIQTSGWEEINSSDNHSYDVIDY